MSIALPRSLRARMLWSLLAVILLGAVIQGVSAYRTALKEANRIFDYNMQQMALSMRSGIPLANGGDSPDFDSGFGNFDFVVQIWTDNGVRIFESSPTLILPQRAVLGFSNVRTSRSQYRVFSLQTNSRVIQVAQDLAVRKQMAGGLALRTVGPIAMMVPLLMLVTWWVVTRSLSPVAKVRRQVASRAADDLSPVSEEGLPDEVRPLVHELNLLLGRVRTAFEAQRHFVADAAHELRSPLAALSLQVQTLRRAGDEAGREVAATRLAAGIERASRLIEQLLMLARQEASAATGARMEPVDLLEIVRYGIAEMTPLAHERDIDLGLQETPATVRIEGQPQALAILLRNLIDNALKYTPMGGIVDVGIVASDRVTLIVEDSGPGIGAESRERVLARFDRTGQPAVGVSGSGLGLAIVKTIAERHGADLKLERSSRLGGLRVAVRFAAEPYLRPNPDSPAP